MVDIDTSSLAYQIGKLIGEILMTYIMFRLIIKGLKIILNYLRVLLTSSMAMP